MFYADLQAQALVFFMFFLSPRFSFLDTGRLLIVLSSCTEDKISHFINLEIKS